MSWTHDASLPTSSSPSSSPRAISRFRLLSLLLGALFIFVILLTHVPQPAALATSASADGQADSPSISYLKHVTGHAMAPLRYASSFFDDDDGQFDDDEQASPECRVPTLRHTESEYTPLESAFAEAWRERCRLDQDKFSIFMTSSNPRSEVVKRNLERFTSGKIPSLGAVYLRWIGDLPTESLYNPTTTLVPVHFSHQLNGSLNARWQPLEDLTTAWVFSHDDDLEIDPSDFEWAWQRSKEFRPAFTSFVGRRWDFDAGKKEPSYKVGKEGDYPAMGTSASWIHSAFMDIYNDPFLAPIRDLVEETQNCEDIAMAFIVPYLLQLPPVLVNGVKDIVHWQFHKNMVSGEKDHWKKRDICSRAFYKHFGEMPLERPYTVLRGMGKGDRKIQMKHIWN